MTAITSPQTTRFPIWLALVALFGLIVPNGLFVYWAVAEFTTLGAVLRDKLAVAFILDCVLVLVLLSVYFARRPIGPVRWTSFVALSLLGGLGFSLPVYYWLNVRRAAR